MIENLALPGEIPEFYDVLDRRPGNSPDSPADIEYLYLRGEFPNKGTVFNRETGRETFVEIYKYPGLKPRYIKNQKEVAPDHPLFNILVQRREFEKTQQYIVFESK